MPQLKQIPRTEHPIVLRTDFSDDEIWEQVKAGVAAPHTIHFAFSSNEASADVDFVSNKIYKDWQLDDVLADIGLWGAHFERPSEGYICSFIMIADAETMTNKEHPLLVIDLVDERGRSFRAAPSSIFSIESNLSISNMDFAEFADWIDDDGIHRGE